MDTSIYVSQPVVSPTSSLFSNPPPKKINRTAGSYTFRANLLEPLPEISNEIQSDNMPWLPHDQYGFAEHPPPCTDRPSIDHDHDGFYYEILETLADHGLYATSEVFEVFQGSKVGDPRCRQITRSLRAVGVGIECLTHYLFVLERGNMEMWEFLCSAAEREGSCELVDGHRPGPRHRPGFHHGPGPHHGPGLHHGPGPQHGRFPPPSRRGGHHEGFGMPPHRGGHHHPSGMPPRRGGFAGGAPPPSHREPQQLWEAGPDHYGSDDENAYKDFEPSDEDKALPPFPPTPRRGGQRAAHVEERRRGATHSDEDAPRPPRRGGQKVGHVEKHRREATHSDDEEPPPPRRGGQRAAPVEERRRRITRDDDDAPQPPQRQAQRAAPVEERRRCITQEDHDAPPRRDKEKARAEVPALVGKLDENKLPDEPSFDDLEDEGTLAGGTGSTPIPGKKQKPRDRF